jgi:hypothetical protein
VPTKNRRSGDPSADEGDDHESAAVWPVGELAAGDTPGAGVHVVNADDRDWFQVRRSQPTRRIASVTSMAWPTKKISAGLANTPSM